MAVKVGEFIVKTNTSQFSDALTKHVDTNIGKAATLLEGYVTQKVRIPGAPGARRSRPGEYPRIDLTHNEEKHRHLWKSYRTHQVKSLHWIVFNTQKHSIALEKGISDGTKREHLSRGLAEKREDIAKIITTPMS